MKRFADISRSVLKLILVSTYLIATFGIGIHRIAHVPLPTDGGAIADGSFADGHPLTEDRIAETRRDIARLPQRSTITNEAAFEQVQARV